MMITCHDPKSPVWGKIGRSPTTPEGDKPRDRLHFLMGAFEMPATPRDPKKEVAVCNRPPGEQLDFQHKPLGCPGHCIFSLSPLQEFRLGSLPHRLASKVAGPDVPVEPHV